MAAEEEEWESLSSTLAIPASLRPSYSRLCGGEYAAALVLAQEILASDPTDAVGAAIYAACCAELDDASIPIDVDFDDPTTRLSLDSSVDHSEMYGRFLDSDYPAALELAESVLQGAPDDAFALAVQDASRTALRSEVQRS